MAFLVDAQELKPGLIIFRRADVKHRTPAKIFDESNTCDVRSLTQNRRIMLVRVRPAGTTRSRSEHVAGWSAAQSGGLLPDFGATRLRPAYGTSDWHAILSL